VFQTREGGCHKILFAISDHELVGGCWEAVKGGNHQPRFGWKEKGWGSKWGKYGRGGGG